MQVLQLLHRTVLVVNLNKKIPIAGDGDGSAVNDVEMRKNERNQQSDRGTRVVMRGCS